MSFVFAGDWMGFNPESANRGTSGLTPPSAVTAFYHVLATSYMSEMATVLGNTKDAAAFVARHTKILAAYHARFYDASVGGYSPCVEGAVIPPPCKVCIMHCYSTSGNGSQTSNSMVRHERQTKSARAWGGGGGAKGGFTERHTREDTARCTQV
jgi:hypothetical protein